VTVNHGIYFGMAAYGLWGVLPLYWKLLKHVPALEILAHRISWSFLFLGILMLASRPWSGLCQTASHWRVWRINAAAALLISINWLTYIWGVNANRIVETSLGYYINPLVSVILGVVFLHERLRLRQWFAVGLAAVAVAYLAIRLGELPWVAIVLASSFAFYGLLKKLSSLNALHGLVLETGLLALPAAGYLGWLGHTHQGALGQTSPTVNLLLVFTGVVTALPLLLFAAAARRVALSTLGLLQYIAPTCGLFIGIGVYHESFGRDRLMAFILIWIALGLYWWDSHRRQVISKAQSTDPA
jgi:chloramphenicol-sensitive protein RarD